MTIIMVSSEISAGKAMGTPRPPVMMLKAGRLGGWEDVRLKKPSVFTIAQWGFNHQTNSVATTRRSGLNWIIED